MFGWAFKTLGRLVAGLVVYIAMPAGFAVFGHDPVAAIRQGARTSFMHDDGSLLLAMGTVAGWAFWAYFAFGFLIALGGKITGHPVRVPGFGPSQALAALMLATITTTAAAPALTNARSVATVTQMPMRADMPPADTADHHAEAANRQDATPPASTPADDHVVSHLVQRHETLIDLAERYYGDAEATSRIIEANIGVPQPDGRSLQTGQIRIYTGWTLRIPAPTVTTAHTSTAPVPAAETAISGTVYEIRKGDYLWFIAERFLGDPERFSEIAACNPDLISDPDRIQPGWRLTLPEDAHDIGARAHATGELVTPDPPARPVGPQPATPTTAPAHEPSQASGKAIDPSEPATASTTPQPTRDVPPRPTADIGRDRTDHDDVQRRTSAHHLQLPSGGWITASMVTALALALVVARLQRRRRATAQWPIKITHTPTEAPMSATVEAIAAAGLSTLVPPAEDTIQPPSLHTPIALDGEDNELSLHRDLLGVTAFSGPGADAAARALIAAALTSSLREWGAGRAELRTDAGTLQHLLDTRALTGGVARMGISPDAAAAVAFAEQEAVFRARVLADNDADDINALHADADNDALGLFVLITPADDATLSRAASVAAQGTRLGIAVIILGETTDIPAVNIAPDGTLAPVPGRPARPKLSGRIATLAAADLADALTLLTDATEPPTMLNLLPDGPAEAAPEADGQADLQDTRNSDTDPEAHEQAHHEDEPLPAAQLARPRDHSAHVRLSVLGIPSLCPPGWDRTPPGIRHRTPPILCFLATRPRGATLNEILTALQPESIDWPDDDDERRKDDRPKDDRRKKAHANIQSTITTMRAILREIDGGHHMYIRQKRRVYYIDPETVEVDLWRMHAHMAQANHAANDHDALAALHQAVACYTGNFASDNEQTWVEPQRALYRRQYLDALTRIAEIQEAEHPDAALAALEQAIDTEEVNEQTYQTIMRVQGRLGRTDAVARTMQLLRERLQTRSESEPRPETDRIYERMLRAAASANAPHHA